MAKKSEAIVGSVATVVEFLVPCAALSAAWLVEERSVLRGRVNHLSGSHRNRMRHHAVTQHENEEAIRRELGSREAAGGLHEMSPCPASLTGLFHCGCEHGNARGRRSGGGKPQAVDRI